MSFAFLVINNKAVVDYNIVQILSEVKNQEIIFHFRPRESKGNCWKFLKLMKIVSATLRDSNWFVLDL